MAPRKSQTPTPASALEQLQRSKSLKLLSIAETLSPKDLPPSAQKRSSAVSDDSEQNGDTHPAALAADLMHYKVLFEYAASLKSRQLTIRRNSSVNYASATSNKSPKRSFCAESPTTHRDWSKARRMKRRRRRSWRSRPVSRSASWRWPRF